jgi:hypothetical protein
MTRVIKGLISCSIYLLYVINKKPHGMLKYKTALFIKPFVFSLHGLLALLLIYWRYTSLFQCQWHCRYKAEDSWNVQYLSLCFGRFFIEVRKENWIEKCKPTSDWTQVELYAKWLLCFGDTNRTKKILETQLRISHPHTSPPPTFTKNIRIYFISCLCRRGLNMWTDRRKEAVCIVWVHLVNLCR